MQIQYPPKCSIDEYLESHGLARIPSSRKYFNTEARNSESMKDIVLAQRKDVRDYRVIKMVTRTAKDLAVWHEIDFLQRLRHPNLLFVEHYYETETHFFVSEEFVNGENLFVQMAAWKRPFSECDLLSLFRQIFSALKFLHQHSRMMYMHVNATHEAIRFRHCHPSCREIKLVDVGREFFLDAGYGAECGSAYYVTIERSESTDTGSVFGDFASTALMLFLILYGLVDWLEDVDRGLMTRIQQPGVLKEFERRLADETRVSSTMTDFLQKIFNLPYSTVRPTQLSYYEKCKGPNVQAIYNHPWLCLDYSSEKAATSSSEPLQDRLISNEPLNDFLEEWEGRLYHVYLCNSRVFPASATLFDYELAKKQREYLFDDLYKVTDKLPLLWTLRIISDSPFFELPSELFLIIYELYLEVVTF